MVHKREDFARYLFQLVVLLAIGACARTDDHALTTKEPSSAHTTTTSPTLPTATIVPETSPSVPSPSEEPVWVLPTHAFMTPVPEFEMELEGPCLPEDRKETELPNPDALQWGLREGQLLELTGLTRDIYTIDVSPDGNWVLLESIDPIGQQLGWVEESALLLTNMGTSEAWIASSSGSIYANRYGWLSEDRFLWVDQERVFVAEMDGSNRVDLQAPEPIWQVWRGAGGIVLAQGKFSMWLLDAIAGTWTEMDIPSLSIIAVAHDGSYVLSLGPAQDESKDFGLYYFDLDIEAQLQLLMESKNIGGHGGPPLPPQQIGTSKLWSSTEWLSFDGPVKQDLGLINIEDMSVVPFSQVPDLDMPAYTSRSFSPDSQWLKLRDPETDSEVILRADMPETRWPVKGVVVAWIQNLEAVLVYDVEKPEGSDIMTKASLFRMNLRDGSTSVFLTDLEHFPDVIVSSDRIFVRDYGPEIRAFSLEGYPLGALRFPEGVIPAIEPFGEDGLSLSFEATAKDDHSGELCQKWGLWIWQP